MKNKKVLIIIIIIAAIIAVSVAVVAKIHMDERNRATIIVGSTTYGDEVGASGYSIDYSKGDIICENGVQLIIENIAWSGNVRIKVQRGELYDSNGNTMETFILKEGIPQYFKTKAGTVTLEVTWIWRE